ncbi:MAG: serine hydrolase domain-containing protein [Fulvivirga sp.]|uniref:serine hydrolase domain-containing protein n=1 Tax=Fulvivirga sp. TaxID=1931237 RepID=UPI0032EF0798
MRLKRIKLKMVIYLPQWILLLLLFISCDNDEISEPKNSSILEKNIVQIARSENIPSIYISINSGKESVNFSYYNPNVDKQLIYGIGSTTKLLSAVLVFRLIEDNKLSLEDAITNFLDSKNSIVGLENVSIRNLLNHTSGLSDYSQNPLWIERVINGNPPKTYEDKIALVDDELLNMGSFNYSNTNYLLLEKAVESVTNKSYKEAFEAFYTQLGLDGIKMGNMDTSLQAFFAQTEEVSINSSNWKEYHGFAGSAYIIPEQLNEFMKLLFIEKSILENKTIDLITDWIPMDSFEIPIGAGLISEYGNGIMNLNYKGEKYIGHIGGTLKYQSFLFYDMNNQISITVVTNCAGSHYNQAFFQLIIPEILDWI